MSATNSTASTSVPSDIDSMSTTRAPSDDDIVEVPIKKKTKLTIAENKAKRQARYIAWKNAHTAEERSVIYRKRNIQQSTKERKAEWWSKNKDRLKARRANLDTL